MLSHLSSKGRQACFLCGELYFSSLDPVSELFVSSGLETMSQNRVCHAVATQGRLTEVPLSDATCSSKCKNREQACSQLLLQCNAFGILLQDHDVVAFLF